MLNYKRYHKNPVVNYPEREWPNKEIEKAKTVATANKDEDAKYYKEYDGDKAKFLEGTDRELLLKFAGTVEAGSVAQYGDDGVTQKATVKVGVASKADAVVPNPVTLTAYRTFVEVEQPCSRFIFRMKQNNIGNVTCGLFEADGGAWQIDAKESIRKFLEKELSDNLNIVILS